MNKELEMTNKKENMNSSGLEEVQAIILANMVYGYNGADIKKESQVGTAEAGLTLKDIKQRARRDVLDEFVSRVKPLLNTVTSQETLEIIFEKFKAEKGLIK